MRRHAFRLPQLPPPGLSALRRRRDRRVDRPAGGAAAAGALFPGDLHAARARAGPGADRTRPCSTNCSSASRRRRSSRSPRSPGSSGRNWVSSASCTPGAASCNGIPISTTSCPAADCGSDHPSWRRLRQPDWLLPVDLLSAVFARRMEEALRAAAPALHAQIPDSCWRGPWVVHSQPAGSGSAVVRYLARYVFRTAISDQAHHPTRRSPRRLSLHRFRDQPATHLPARRRRVPAPLPPARAARAFTACVTSAGCTRPPSAAAPSWRPCWRRSSSCATKPAGAAALAPALPALPGLRLDRHRAHQTPGPRPAMMPKFTACSRPVHPRSRPAPTASRRFARTSARSAPRSPIDAASARTASLSRKQPRPAVFSCRPAASRPATRLASAFSEGVPRPKNKPHKDVTSPRQGSFNKGCVPAIAAHASC